MSSKGTAQQAAPGILWGTGEDKPQEVGVFVGMGGLGSVRFQVLKMSYEKKLNPGWFLGILILAYIIPHIIG